MIENTAQLLEMISRAGGGGSGDDDGSFIIALVGYAPAYYMSLFLLKRLGMKAAIAIGLPFSILWGGLLFYFLTNVFGGIMFFGAILGFFSGVNGLHARILKRSKKAKLSMKKAASLDPAWNPEELKLRVEQVFYSYQQDWANSDSQKISAYTTDMYAYHNWLMLTALHQLSRRNEMSDVKLNDISFVEVNDDLDNSNDKFTVFIKATATDRLVDFRDGKEIYVDKKPFSEFWHFTRDQNKGWVLSSIDQATAKNTLRTLDVMNFAKNNNLYFSLDWGWLLLPKVGDIFSKANFKRSDVNNHCIGMMGKELVQMYTYIPYVGKNNSNYEITVAQIAVPNKNYGRIVIRQKTNWFNDLLKRKPKGLNKLEVEAMEINNRFNIYASDVEQVTTFELLNPSYMQEVINTPGKISIEVYDNTIFIYSYDRKIKYDSVFNLLVRAHKELVR